jgi:hypothetical protein
MDYPQKKKGIHRKDAKVATEQAAHRRERRDHRG